MLQTANGAKRDISLRIYAIIVILGAVCYTLIQQRELLDDIPLVCIHIAEEAQITRTLLQRGCVNGIYSIALPKAPPLRLDGASLALIGYNTLVIADNLVVILLRTSVAQVVGKIFRKYSGLLLILLEAHFAETVATKIYTHGLAVDRGSQHLAIARVDRASASHNGLCREKVIVAQLVEVGSQLPVAVDAENNMDKEVDYHTYKAYVQHLDTPCDILF